MRCEDCGCRTSGGVCSNCQEELYILQEQSEFIDQPVSDEFADKARKQQEELNLRKSR
jgi:hypothetical protein